MQLIHLLKYLLHVNSVSLTLLTYRGEQAIYPLGASSLVSTMSPTHITVTVPTCFYSLLFPTSAFPSPTTKYPHKLCNLFFIIDSVSRVLSSYYHYYYF